jgi:hypothetical protein
MGFRELVTTSAPAATAAAAASISAISATASATLHLGTGFVDVQSAAPELSAVKGGDGFFSVFCIRHFHKPKAA